MITFMIYLIIKRRRLTDEDEIQKFEGKFGTIFEEFKTTGISMWMFYFIYILRRMCIVLSYLFIKDESLQLSLCFVFSVIVIFTQVPLYVLFFRNFKSLGQNIYQFVNEFLIGVFYCITLVSFMSAKVITVDKFNTFCMNLIIASWALCFAITIISSFNELVEKLKKYFHKKRKGADIETKVYPLSKDAFNSKIRVD